MRPRGSQAEILFASNPIFVPHNMMVVLRVLEIMVGVMLFHLSVGVLTRARGVDGDTSFALRWRT